MMARVAAAAAALVVILAAATVWWFYGAMWRPRLPAAVTVEIAAGQPAGRALDDLERDGILRSAVAARLYLRTHGRGRTIHYGRYRFEAGARPVDIVENLLEGAVEMVTLTIVEGSDRGEIGAVFVGAGIGSPAEWQRVTGRGDRILELAPKAPSLEGFLFPDTYRFAVGTTTEQAAAHLVERFLRVWHEERGGADTLWGTPLEIVTLASMVEAETSLPAERGLIAGVFVNRLRRGMLLQCDPTVVYALKRNRQWKGQLLRIHWQLDDPYNTYRYPGLPPGPINSPGRAALAAALRPETTPHLYFVARPDGGHEFSTNLSDHNRAVAKLRAARR